MPVYEYQCSRCGEFELFQSITAKKLKKCPDCRSVVKPLISRSSFQLKGEGWTKTESIKDKANTIEKQLEIEEVRDARQGKVTL